MNSWREETGKKVLGKGTRMLKAWRTFSKGQRQAVRAGGGVTVRSFTRSQMKLRKSQGLSPTTGKPRR